MTHEETLRQWLDGDLGGTMPPEVREAGLALLARLADIEDAHKSVMAEVCGGGPKDVVHCTCVPALRAEVQRLRSDLKWMGEALRRAERAEAELVRMRAELGGWKAAQSEMRAACREQRERAEQAEERLAKVSKAHETVFNTLAMMPKKQPFVVVRTYSAGVHVGTLVSRSGREVTLADARRLWRWSGANTLHEVALRGVDEKYTRLSEPVAMITLTEAIEIIPATAEATANLARSRWGA